MRLRAGTFDSTYSANCLPCLGLALPAESSGHLEHTRQPLAESGNFRGNWLGLLSKTRTVNLKALSGSAAEQSLCGCPFNFLPVT